MAERLGQVIYWISCGIAAVGAIGAAFWLVKGVLYEGDEVAFTIAAIFSVSGVVSYLIGRAVREGRFLRQRFGDVALWLSDLVDRYRFRDEKKQYDTLISSRFPFLPRHHHSCSRTVRIL